MIDTQLKIDKECFAKFWLSSSLRSLHNQNPTPKNGYRHYLALPARHPKQEKYYLKNNGICEIKFREWYFEKRNMWQRPAANMRFGVMAAVPPQTILCGNERLYSAGSLVEAATTPSRWDVMRQRWTVRWRRARNQDVKSWQLDKEIEKLNL